MSSDSTNQPRPEIREVRWWPAWFVLFAGGIHLFWLWRLSELSRQDKNIRTVITIFCAFVLLLIWSLWGARFSRGVRVSILVLVVLFLVGSAATLRIRGVTGDLFPILEWRWEDRSRVESPVTASAQVTIPDSPSFPQFQGTFRTGLVMAEQLDPAWFEKQPSPLWRKPVGRAWSGFAVAAGRAITQEQKGDEEQVVCYDLGTGSILWVHSDRSRYATTIAGEGPRATPAIDGDRVYAVGATGILNCLDAATGKVIWTRNFIAENKTHAPEWGVSCSPLVSGKLVIVHPGASPNHSLEAYDKMNGQPVWHGGDQGESYSSPLLARLAGQDHVLIFTSRAVTGHDARSGRELWSYPWPTGHPHITLPLVLPGDRVLISSGYGTGAELVQISRESNGKIKAQRVWKAMQLKSKFANLIYDDGFIYGLDDGILVCLDAGTGKVQWKEGRYGHGQLLRWNRFLLLMAETGDFVVLDLDPREHRERARFPVFKTKTWNPPAMAGSYLVLRNDQEAVCLNLGK